MKQISAIIADDEERLRNSLKSKLQTLWTELVICGEAANGLDALDLFETYQPDILFLDIKMPGITGMEVAERIVGKCQIVFVTAFDHYALKAFENEAVDYLIKPVTEERLRKTIIRLQKSIGANTPPSSDLKRLINDAILELSHDKESKYLSWIKAPCRNEIRIVPVEDVCYFMAKDKYTLVKTRDVEYVIRKSIKSLEEELDPRLFWRVHRGTIINVNEIAKVYHGFSGKFVIKLKNLSETLPVSRAYQYLFK